MDETAARDHRLSPRVRAPGRITAAVPAFVVPQRDLGTHDQVRRIAGVQQHLRGRAWVNSSANP